MVILLTLLIWFLKMASGKSFLSFNYRLYTYLALVGKTSFDPLVKSLTGTCDSGSVKVLDIVLMWVKDFFPQKRLENTTRATVFQIFTAYYKNVIVVLEKGHKRLIKIQENNNEHFIARGAVSEDRVEKYNASRDQLKAVLADIVAIAPYLELVPPGIVIDEDAVINHASSGGYFLEINHRNDFIGYGV
jgi:hypothetical protein